MKLEDAVVLACDMGCLNGMLTTQFIVLHKPSGTFSELLSAVDEEMSGIRESEDREALRQFAFGEGGRTEVDGVVLRRIVSNAGPSPEYP